LEKESMNATLHGSDDPVKLDLELICDLCGEHIVDAEDGDSLQVLVEAVEDHNKIYHIKNSS
jgi:hypothetical protein